MLPIVLSLLFACIVGNLAEEPSFAERCLNAHTHYRYLHDVPPLVLDPDLQAYAQELANTTRREDLLPEVPFGLIRSFFLYRTPTPEKVVYLWHDSGYYSYNWEDISKNDVEVISTFAQVVWKNTTKLGCAAFHTLRDYGPETVVVAVYDPKGNIPDEYAENVFFLR